MTRLQLPVGRAMGASERNARRRGPARLVASLLLALVVPALLLSLATSTTETTIAADPPNPCTGPGWELKGGVCRDVGMWVGGEYRHNTPGYGQASCDSPDAATYKDSNIPVRSGHTFVDGSPICIAASYLEGKQPTHPDSIREMVSTPPAPTPPEAKSRPAPVLLSRYGGNDNLANLGRYGKCGGKAKPRDLTLEDIFASRDYLCDTDAGEWVLVQYGRAAADWEVDWYPVGACDRQISGPDPYGPGLLVQGNENFSQEACDAWLVEELEKEWERRKAAAGDGSVPRYCQVIGTGRRFGGDYAWGQVFLNAPNEDGDRVVTPIYWGTYADAVEFASTDSGCNPGASSSARSIPASLTTRSTSAASDEATATDTTPPTVQRAVHSDDDHVVVITFSEDLDATSKPSSHSFGVRRGSGIAAPSIGVTIQGAQVTLEFEADLGDGTLEVYYIKPSADPLRDEAGNEVQSFDNYAVTRAEAAAEPARPAARAVAGNTTPSSSAPSTTQPRNTGDGPIDYKPTSDPCDAPWQVPGSYNPQTGCRQR